MGVAALKLKIMPESPELDLEELKPKIEKSLKQAGTIRINSIQEEPVAFGLKALIVTIAWPEEKETEEAETACKVQGVSSVQIIDYRRAFG